MKLNLTPEATPVILGGSGVAPKTNILDSFNLEEAIIHWPGIHSVDALNHSDVSLLINLNKRNIKRTEMVLDNFVDNLGVVSNKAYSKNQIQRYKQKLTKLRNLQTKLKKIRSEVS